MRRPHQFFGPNLKDDRWTCANTERWTSWSSRRHKRGEWCEHGGDWLCHWSCTSPALSLTRSWRFITAVSVAYDAPGNYKPRLREVWEAYEYEWRWVLNRCNLQCTSCIKRAERVQQSSRRAAAVVSSLKQFLFWTKAMRPFLLCGEVRTVGTMILDSVDRSTETFSAPGILLPTDGIIKYVSVGGCPIKELAHCYGMDSPRTVVLTL